MDLPDIEFITTNDFNIKEEMELKAEYLDDYEADVLEQDVCGYRAKCGEIMVSTSGSFTLICAFCDDEFGDIPSFGGHLHLKHLNDDLEEIPTVATPLKQSEEPHSEKERDRITSNSINGSQYSIERLENYDLIENLYSDDDSIQSSTPNDEPIQIIVQDPHLFCKICCRQYKSSAAFTCHQNRHNPQPIEIEKKSTKDSVLANDANSNSSPAPEPPSDPNMYCEICNRQFKSKRAFRDHGARHSEIPNALKNDPTFLKCKYCNEEFTKVLDRVHHEFAHGKNKRYFCWFCPKTFRMNYQRHMHVNTHTGARPHKCKMCPKTFASPINRLQHERVHLGLKRHVCEICKKRFSSSGERIIHLRSHTGETPYQCDECGKRFTTSSRLCNHKRRHGNNRDFKCDTCGLTFFYNYELTKHKITHTDIRPFKCTVCGQDFQTRRSLVNHQKIHLEIKQYGCTICGKRFAQKAGLHAHNKTHGEKLSSKISGWF